MNKQCKALLGIIVFSVFLPACQTTHTLNSVEKQQAKPVVRVVETLPFKSPKSSPKPYQANYQTELSSQVISHMKEYIGTPYVFGGESDEGIDCSSLMQTSFAKLGIDIPRTATDQYQASSEKDQPEPGDLLFFDIKNNGRISHVGMYIGDGKMIHASTSRKQVRTANVNKQYWQKRIKKVGSFL